MVRRESSFETRNTGTGMPGCTVVSGDVRERSVRVSRLSFFLGRFGSKTANAGELPGRTDIGDDEELELRKNTVREEFADFDENFELREQIADGGQGLISRAVDKKLNRIVAVKTLNGTLKERSSSRNAFVAEARVTGRLDHPAVVPVHGLYSDSVGNLHLAMKLVRGDTLKEYLDKTASLYRRMPRRQVERGERKMLQQRLEIFLRVCEAVAYAHHRKVIHRDLKPENIMIGSFSETYVMDWGIAEHQSWKDAGSASGKFSGTVQYAAPEIINNQAYDSRSDIYSLGLILFEMVYLKPAYPSGSMPEAVEMARKGRIAFCDHRFRCRVDRDLTMIVRKALAPLPAERYQNVKSLMKDLRSYLRCDEVSANPDGIRGRLFRSFRRNYRPLLLIWGMLLLGCMCLVSLFLYREMEKQAVRRQTEAAFSEIYSKGVHAATQFDFRLHSLENLLNTLSWETSLLLERPAAGGEEMTFYGFSGAARPEGEPSGFAYSPVYRRKIDLDTFVYLVPRAVRPETVELRGTLLKLDPLRRGFFRLVSQSLAEVSPVPAGEEKQKEMIRSFVKPPFAWVYVGLKSGLYVCYPYHDDCDGDYDPRQRPWYRLAEEAADRQAVWSEPYIGHGAAGKAGRGELIVTCARAVTGDDGRVLGVAAADITLARLREMMLQNVNTSRAVTNRYLVDEGGRIIIGSGSGPEDETAPEDGGFRQFPNPELLRTIRDRRNGRLFVTEDGVRRLYFFQKIETVGWMYIERIDFAEMLRSKHKTTNKLSDIV